MLASAGIIYGSEFNPLLALKALAYHEDRALAGVSAGVRRDLAETVRTTDPRRLPRLTAVKSSKGRRGHEAPSLQPGSPAPGSAGPVV
jgi:hypothetical protein